jgi:hypothetical protein
LDVQDQEKAAMSKIRIQTAKLAVQNDQVLFHGQVQELKDVQNDARVEKILKLKHSLKEASLDAAHNRSSEYVAQSNDINMANRSFDSLRRQRREESTALENTVIEPVSPQEKRKGPLQNNRVARSEEDRCRDGDSRVVDERRSEEDNYDDDDGVRPPWMV